jgi:hypothetical protein
MAEIISQLKLSDIFLTHIVRDCSASLDSAPVFCQHDARPLPSLLTGQEDLAIEKMTHPKVCQKL